MTYILGLPFFKLNIDRYTVLHIHDEVMSQIQDESYFFF